MASDFWFPYYHSRRIYLVFAYWMKKKLNSLVDCVKFNVGCNNLFRFFF